MNRSVEVKVGATLTLVKPPPGVWNSTPAMFYNNDSMQFTLPASLMPVGHVAYLSQYSDAYHGQSRYNYTQKCTAPRRGPAPPPRNPVPARLRFVYT